MAEYNQRPTVPLPPQASLEQQKKRAKELLRAHRAGDADAGQCVSDHLPRHEARRPIALHDAQLVVAREYGFESWPKLAAYIRAGQGADPELVHARGGDGQRPLHFAREIDAVRLMLDLGFGPSARGMDEGTVLHLVCWKGNLELVDLLLRHDPPINDANDVHGCPPLGWCAYGSHMSGCAEGRHLDVAERLIEAGADVHAAGNKHGHTMTEMAGDNTEMQELLRRHGAE